MLELAAAEDEAAATTEIDAEPAAATEPADGAGNGLSVAALAVAGLALAAAAGSLVLGRRRA